MTVHEKVVGNFEADSLLADMLVQWIGCQLNCTKKNGKKFMSRLVAIKGDKLFFENKSGEICMDSLEDLKSASPMVFRGGLIDRKVI